MHDPARRLRLFGGALRMGDEGNEWYRPQTMEVESSDGFSLKEDHFEGEEVVVCQPSEPGGKKGFLSRQRELMTLMSLLPPQADIRQLEAQAETANEHTIRK